MLLLKVTEGAVPLQITGVAGVAVMVGVGLTVTIAEVVAVQLLAVPTIV